jgi:hypothetical protein
MREDKKIIMKGMKTFNYTKPYFGLRGGWLTFWITVACGADMTLYGYDQVNDMSCYDFDPHHTHMFV